MSPKDSLYQQLRSHLACLEPAAAAEALPAALDQAISTGQTHTEFLEQLPAVEVDATEARRLARRTRFANFPAPRRLEDFDFSAQPSIDAAPIRDLATSRYTVDATNILFIGPPGAGKTMLAAALGHEAVEAGLRVYYSTAADLAARCRKAAIEGRRLPPCDSSPAPPCSSSTSSATRPCPHRTPTPCSKPSPSCLKSSIILTTNRGASASGDIFGDATIAAAMLDRLLHRCAVINIAGDSYRLRAHQARNQQQTTTIQPPRSGESR